jgi:hypothetical protein
MTVSQDRKRKELEISGGNRLALQVNRRKKRRRDDPSYTGTQDFIARVVVKLATKSSRLVISVNQAQFSAAGSFLSIPRLAIHNIVPSHSPIFELAREGKLQSILELVGNGQASPHDRDEHGWSLLHVSPAHDTFPTLFPYLQDC